MNGIGLSFGNTSACLAALPKNELVVGINVQGNRTTPTTLTNSFGDLAINYDCNFNVENVTKLKYLVNSSEQVDVAALTKSVAFIFNEIAQTSYNCLMTKSVQLVMAIPPRSSKRYRKMLTTVVKQAIGQAGATFRLKQLVHEPIAVLIYYEFVSKANRDIFVDDQSVVCFKVGGLLSELTQVSIIENGLFQIDSYTPFKDCGSDLITQAIFEHFLALLEKCFNAKFNENEKIKSRLRKEAEICKKTSLKTSTAYKINMESVYNGQDWSQTVSIYSIEAAIKKSIGTIVEPLRAFLAQDAAKEVELNRKKISRVFLYGGGFHLTALQRAVREQIDACYEIFCDPRPDEIVAKGCAVQYKMHEIDDSCIAMRDGGRLVDFKLVQDLHFFANELEIFDLNKRKEDENERELPLLVVGKSSVSCDMFEFAYAKRFDEPIRLEIYERVHDRRYRYEKVVLGEHFHATVSFIRVNKAFGITIKIESHE